MPEPEGGNRPVARAGQDRERDQRSVASLDVDGRRHAMDDMANLLQSRNARWTGRLGNARVLGREIEVFSVRIGDAGFVTRLPGEPDKEPLQCGRGGVQGRLTQRLAASAALFGKVTLESP